MDKKMICKLITAAAAIGSAAGICSSVFTLPCYIVALLGLFIVDLAGSAVFSLCVNVLFLGVTFVFGGAECALFLGFAAVLLSWVMSFIMKTTEDFSYTAVGGIVVFALSFAVCDFLIKAANPDMSLFGIFGTVVDSVFSEMTANMKTLSNSAGYSKESIDLMLQYISAAADSVKLMLPGIIISAGGIACVVALLLSSFFIGGIPVPPLSGIRAPRSVVYVFFLIYFVGGFIGGDSISFIIANVSLVLSCFMMLCGFSTVKYFTDKIKLKPLSLIIFVILIPLCLAMNTILIFVGMADGILKFRRIDNEKE